MSSVCSDALRFNLKKNQCKESIFVQLIYSDNYWSNLAVEIKKEGRNLTSTKIVLSEIYIERGNTSIYLYYDTPS